MKLLESTALEALNSALSLETGQYKIIGRYVMLLTLFLFPSCRVLKNKTCEK